jgi:hypothetical protein
VQRWQLHELRAFCLPLAGVISPAKPGQGICAVKINECWVKDVPRGSCVQFTGNQSKR